MGKVTRDFQVFVKPAGASCNMACRYCYYLEKSELYPGNGVPLMPDKVLDEYIRQHIDATGEGRVMFSWHGGEPLLCGIDFFRKTIELQNRYLPDSMQLINGIQTNGTLIDAEWARFFAENGFYAGISIDGPEELHDAFRRNVHGQKSFQKVMRGYDLLLQYGVDSEILCVVNSFNVQYPLEVYRFFRDRGARYISFLPLVVQDTAEKTGVTRESVPASAFGRFLWEIFYEWKEKDIGRVKIQIFEEAARTAFGQDHTLCIFRKICGAVPVVEHNGDFYSCDHFVDAAHYRGNIMERSLSELLDSPVQKGFGQAKLDSLPQYCLECDVLEMCNGECPRNRFVTTPGGEKGLNYLCSGYRMFFRHCTPFVKEVADLWNRIK